MKNNVGSHIPFSEKNLLKLILRHKQTFGTLLNKFGYQETMCQALEHLISTGKIRGIWCYDKGWRLVFVKPDYDESKLKTKKHNIFIKKFKNTPRRKTE